MRSDNPKFVPPTELPNLEMRKVYEEGGIFSHEISLERPSMIVNNASIMNTHTASTSK